MLDFLMPVIPLPIQPISRKVGLKQFKYYQIHKTIHSRSEIYNSLPILNYLRKDPRERLAIAPKVIAQVFYNVGVIDLNGLCKWH